MRPTKPQAFSGHSETPKTWPKPREISDQLESVLKTLNISALNSHLEAREDFASDSQSKVIQKPQTLLLDDKPD